jgi:hypothetical protein
MIMGAGSGRGESQARAPSPGFSKEIKIETKEIYQTLI